MSIEQYLLDIVYDTNRIRKMEAELYSSITRCCGASLLNFLNEVHNQGIVVSVSEETINCPRETDEYWIESVVLEEGYTMHIKHRKEFYDEDCEDED